MLIILATISINAVLGENGLIKKAQQAKDIHRAGSVEESVNLWKTSKKLNEYMEGSSVQTRDELIADLVNQGLLTTDEKTTIEETGSVTIGGKTIVFGNDAKTLVEMFDAGEIKIGDYVNYQNPTSGTYTSSGTKTGMQNYKDNGSTVADDDLNQVYNVANNQLNWRILGKDEATGGLKLIAGSPMKKETTSNNPYFMMYGAQSYISGVDELNNICALYKNNLAQAARSVNMDDVNAITGITTADKIKEVNLDPVMNSSAGAKQYGDTYSYVEHYTPESWLNNKTKTTVSGTVDGYFYAINAPAEAGMPSATVSDTNAYNLLFNNVEYGSGACYWLASRGVRARSAAASFGPGGVNTEDGVTMAGSGGSMFISGGGERYDGLAVRPVVVLKSSITEEDIQVIGAQTETTWNYGG